MPVDRNQVELPFARPEAAAPAEPAARPQPMFGPVGRQRSAAAVSLLSVVTLGIYALAWHHRVNRELEEFDPKLHSRPAAQHAAVMVPWLTGLPATLAGRRVITAPLSIHLPFDSTWPPAGLRAAGRAGRRPYLTLLLPFSAVAVVMTLERLRCVEEHVGTTTDRQVRAGGHVVLLLIPLVGGRPARRSSSAASTPSGHAVATPGGPSAEQPRPAAPATAAATPGVDRPLRAAPSRSGRAPR